MDSVTKPFLHQTVSGGQGVSAYHEILNAMSIERG
jgi:hypothetical protein